MPRRSIWSLLRPATSNRSSGRAGRPAIWAIDYFPISVLSRQPRRNQLAASVHVLCEHPDQWALLGQHPELAVNAVEETMRHSPIAFGILRTATEDVELAGVMIPAGTLVVPVEPGRHAHDDDVADGGPGDGGAGEGGAADATLSTAVEIVASSWSSRSDA